MLQFNLGFAMPNMLDTSSFVKKTVEGIFSAYETAKGLDISFARFQKGSEEESISEHPLVKKGKLVSKDDTSLTKPDRDKSKDLSSKYDIFELGNEHRR